MPNIHTTPANTIPILISKNNRYQTKVFNRDGVRSIAPEMNWGVEVETVDDVQDILDLLENLEDEPCKCVIRGDLKDSTVPPFGVLRRYTTAADPWQDTPRSWVMFDLDDVPGDTADDMREQCPEIFHGAACVVQWSASDGYTNKQGCRKAHVWFMLSEPMTSEQIKRYVWSLNEGHDLSVFNAVQIHYTAGPKGNRPDPHADDDRAVMLDGDPTVDAGYMLLALDTLPDDAATHELGDVVRHSGEVEDCVDRLRMSMPSGSRHGMLNGWIKEAVSKGMTSEEIHAEVAEYWQKEEPERYSYGEVDRQISGAIQKLADGSLQLSRLPVSQVFGAAVEDDELAEDDDENDDIELYGTNEVVNARLFLKRNFPAGGLLRWGEIDYSWARTHWRRHGSNEELVSMFTKDADTAVAGSMKSSTANNSVKSIRMRVLRHDISMPCLLSEPGDDTAQYINMRNGLLDIDKALDFDMEPVVAHTLDYFSTAAPLNFDYDESADCPTWKRCLSDWFPGDTASHREMQKMFGYLLTHDTSQEKMFILHGKSRGGKGTVTHVLAKLFGDQFASPSIESFGRGFALEGLQDKRIAMFEEVNNENSRTIPPETINRLKTITGRGRLDVDRKGVQVLHGVEIKARIVMTCNRMPGFIDPSGALARRMVIFHFANSFLGRENTGLKDQLEDELAGIFNWAVEGIHMLRKDGRFNEMLSSEEVMNTFRDMSAPTTAFFRECVDAGVQGADFLTNNALYETYGEWCSQTNHRAISRQKFNVEMRDFYPTATRGKTKIGGRQQRGYWGVKFSDDASDYTVDIHATCDNIDIE